MQFLVPQNSNGKHLAHCLVGGAISSLLFIILTGIVGAIGAAFAQVPLFIIGCLYAKQDKNIAIGILFATALVVVFQGLEHSLTYLIYISVPGFLLPKLAMQSQKEGDKEVWYPFTRLIGSFGAYCLVICTIQVTIWVLFGVGEQTYNIMMATVNKADPAVQERVLEALPTIKMIWPYMAGVAVGVYVLLTIWSGMIAQRWLKVKGKKLARPGLLLSDLYLPWWCWKVFAVTGLAFVFGLQFNIATLSYFAGSLSLVLIALFTLQGLAVLNTFAKKQKNTKMILVVSYVFMIVFSWILVVLVLLGLLEPWLNLRERINNHFKE